MNSEIILRSTFATILLCCSLLTCRAEPLPEGDEAFHREAGQRLCEKMISCLGPYTRTLREDAKRSITVEACVASVEKRLSARRDFPDRVYTLARTCYAGELKADCRSFFSSPLRNPACLSLFLETPEP